MFPPNIQLEPRLPNEVRYRLFIYLIKTEIPAKPAFSPLIYSEALKKGT